jgi:hypothetical protein
MRTVRLYITMTCDGCFAGPSGELSWSAANPPAVVRRRCARLPQRDERPAAGDGAHETLVGQHLDRPPHRHRGQR